MVQGHVLVLNKSWVAIHIASVRRALTLMYMDAASAIHPVEFAPYDFERWVAVSQNGLGGRYIYTPRLRIRIPEVIILTHFNGFIRHEVRFSRASLFERDKNRCQYCGQTFPRSQLTIDHIIPQSRGGEDTWENLAVACLRCNVKKGSRTPDEWGVPLIRTPQKPAWAPLMGNRVPREQLAIWQKFVDPRGWKVVTDEEAGDSEDDDAFFLEDDHFPEADAIAG
jgi:5-methylcytosine-specific restriction endonuclease McrA